MSGALTLDVLDVYGNHIPENVDLFFHNNSGGPIPCARDCNGSRRIKVTALDSGLYKLEIDVPCYRDIGIFVNIFDDDTLSQTVTAAIDPRRVIDISAPIFTDLNAAVRSVLSASTALLGPRSPSDFYESLDPIRKAGLLNLTCKASNTRQANGTTVFSTDYFQCFTEIRGDRLFAVVSENLIGATRDSSLNGNFVFHKVDESLHTIAGCDPVASYKTQDHYGNLQLSFFRRQSDGAFLVDMDIDDAQGFAHIFQVLGNAIAGEPTHPYNIHEILVGYQKLDPGYTMQVRPQKAAAGAGGG